MTPTPEPALPRDQLDRATRLARRALRHPWAAAIAFVAGMAAVAGLVLLRPQRYLSETVLHYQEGIQWDAGEGRESTRDVGYRLKETLLARSRLPELVTELQVYPKEVAAGRMDDAVEELLRRTTFRVNEGSTFTITYAGESAESAQRVTARLAELLISDNLRLRSEQFEVARKFLDEQARRNEESLRAKEVALARFLARHPEFVPEVAAGSSATTRAATRTRVAAPPPDAGYRREAAPRAPGAAPSSGPPPELVNAERQSQDAVAQARRELDDQRRRFTEFHPSVMAATQRVREAEQAHQAAADALRAATPVSAAPASSLSPRPRRSAPAPEVVAPRESPETLVRLETEYATLAREVQEEREKIQRLDSRHFVATMAANAFSSGNAGQITVISPAYRPARPTGTKTKVLLVAGLAASLLLGAVAAAVASALDDRLLDRVDVERAGLGPVLGDVEGLGAPVAAGEVGPADGAPAGTRALPGTGALAHPGKGGPLARTGGAEPPGRRKMSELSSGGDGSDPRLVLLRSPDSLPAAGFRILRHRLAERGGAPSLLVTSAGPGEGKTTCAVNLALALSEGGRANVLLLDGNFRRPALGALLGLPAPKPQRRGAEPEPPWSTIEVVTPWLHVSAAPAEPWRALADGPTVQKRLVDLGAAGYDVIVVDGPPVLGSADVHLLEEGVSGIVLAAWAGWSRARRLREAVRQVGAERVMGVVLLHGARAARNA